MSNLSGHVRLYDTLCRVLDAIRREASPADKVYNPPQGNSDAEIQARSRALLHLFLKARFGMVRFADREPFVTDGQSDGGIDAYYIDRQNKCIYVLQSKFRATAGNFVSTNMTASDLLKMDVSRILRGEKAYEDGTPYNEGIRRLQKAIRLLPDAGSYTKQVVLLGNTKKLSTGQLKKLMEGYNPEQYNHDRTYRELLFPVINGTYFTEENLTIEISLANVKGASHLDYEVRAGSLRPNIKLIFVPTQEIGRIMFTYRNSILKYNPRSFLDLERNPVNQEIEASIRSIDSNEFALFNNGITIITDSTSVSTDTAKLGTGQVVLRNPQLVNGAQTAYTLARVYEDCSKDKDFKVFKGKEVLLRVITFVGLTPSRQNSRLALIGDISKASNSQTKVEDSDRRSNDPVQLSLQREFFEKYGLYYERKRGEFSDGLRAGYLPSDLVVNRERLVRVALACEYRATQARSSIGKFFKGSALGSLLRVGDCGKYVYGYEVFSLLEKKRRQKPAVKGDRYHTKSFGQALRYGQYAVVAVCANLGPSKGMTEARVLDAILLQWAKFETWAEKRQSNGVYVTDNNAFDYVNYYKGSTINGDLQRYKFLL